MRGCLATVLPRTGSILIPGPEIQGEGFSRDAKQPGGASLVTARLIVNKFHVTGDGRGERKVAHVRFPVRRELRIALPRDRRRARFQVWRKNHVLRENDTAFAEECHRSDGVIKLAQISGHG